jgi:hypothetical protein
LHGFLPAYGGRADAARALQRYMPCSRSFRLRFRWSWAGA